MFSLLKFLSTNPPKFFAIKVFYNAIPLLKFPNIRYSANGYGGEISLADLYHYPIYTIEWEIFGILTLTNKFLAHIYPYKQRKHMFENHWFFQNFCLQPVIWYITKYP